MGYWKPYEMEYVVDTNDAAYAVRNYLEQKDLRCYISLAHNMHPVMRAAEFGCGFGRMVQVLTEFAPEVIGIEREALMVEEAGKLIPDVTFHQADDLANAPIDNNSLDLVTTFTFLQHLVDTQAKRVIQEIKRCLHPKGHVLICEETDQGHISGDINDPLGQCTIGRPVNRYEALFSPLKLRFTAPRRIEPGYKRADTGTYMLFASIL